MRVVFVGRDRRILKRLVYHPLTLGISRRVWMHRILKEVDGHQALGYNHRLHAALLAAPWAGLPCVATVAMLAGPLWWLLMLPLLWASGWMTMRAGRAVAAMLRARPLIGEERVPRFGPPVLWWLLNAVPLLGPMAFFAWTQDRLNRFWALERRHPERGLELDEALDDDPAFLIELGKALQASARPGSRFESGPRARLASWWRARGERAEAIATERAAVRAAGGSTPILPWRLPARPAPRLLHVTCGGCQQAFDVRRDPLADTPILCPGCGRLEVLPALSADPLRPAERAKVPTMVVDCPKCRTQFHAIRNLASPTQLTCPGCGKVDTLPPGPAPSAPQARATAAGSAGRDNRGGPAGRRGASGAARSRDAAGTR